MGHLYIIEADAPVEHARAIYKIGITSTSPKSRLQQLQTGMPYALSVVFSVECSEPRELESALHERFAPCNTEREWFALTPIELEEAKRTAEVYAEENPPSPPRRKSKRVGRKRVAEERGVPRVPAGSQVLATVDGVEIVGTLFVPPDTPRDLIPFIRSRMMLAAMGSKRAIDEAARVMSAYAGGELSVEYHPEVLDQALEQASKLGAQRGG